MQFTVGNVGLQLETKGDEDGGYTRAFGLCMATSFLVAPWWGTACDRFGFPRVFAAINAAALLVPALLLLPSLEAQALMCFVYSTARVGLWASFFSFTGATFGFRNYGKLAGGGLMVQSCFCLLQDPLLRLTLAIHDRHSSWSKRASALSDDTAPSASLDHLVAQAAPTGPRSAACVFFQPPGTSSWRTRSSSPSPPPSSAPSSRSTGAAKRPCECRTESQIKKAPPTGTKP